MEKKVMCSNSDQTAMIVKNSKVESLMKRVGNWLIKRLTWELRLTANYLSLGLQARQWLAIWMICLMLLPIFMTPAIAASVLDNRNSDEIKSQEFEPVNSPQSFWKNAETYARLTLEKVTSSISGPSFYNEKGEKINFSDKTGDKAKATREGEEAGKNVVKFNNDKDVENIDEAKVNVPEMAKASKNKEVVEKVAENEKAASRNYGTKTELKTSTVSAALLLNQLPEDEHGTIYSYENNLGAPTGQVEMAAPTGAVATKIRERAGIANFGFGIPLAALPGRGIDAGAAMTYNSRTWNKSCTQYDTNGLTCLQNHFTYDVEQSWVAPGFSTGFGYLESTRQPLYNNGNLYSYKTYPTGLIEADGTRRQLYCSQLSGSACLAYQTSDGSFIRFSGDVVASNPANATFSAVYPNGSKVYFAGAFGTDTYRKHYPVILQDGNGNRVRVAYKTDNSGRIDKIIDTLKREIKFYYGTDAAGNTDKLVAVTVPGMTTGEELQTVRFYYDNLTVNAQSAFSGQVTQPDAPVQVLRYVYFPATKTGFKYDYHPNYGMIKKITRYVDMTVSTTNSLTATGTVTSDGTWAATTEYDFPDGSTAQTDVPKYTKRTDDLQGRTSALAETFFDVPEQVLGTDRVSRVSVKDKEYNSSTDTYTDFKIVNETISYNTTDWMNGLVKETSVKKKYGVAEQFTNMMAKTKYFWEPGIWASGSRQNPILRKVEITNDAGQTKTIRYEYDQYNNQTAVEEYDFGKNETNASPLRRTEMTYETGAGWTVANLLGLVKSVQTKVGGTVVSKTLYEYDNNGSDATMTTRDDMDTTTHDTFYNPAHPARTERVCPNGDLSDGSQNNLSDPDGCTTIPHPGYSSASAYRGNVTKIGRMLDLTATTISDANSNKTDYNYDIAGNLVSATLSCCQLKTIDYGATFAETGYAYPIKETKGTSPQLTDEAVYNKNTGLVMQTKNENGQLTNYEYESDTLRRKKVTFPNNGYVLTEYSDKLVPSPIGYTRTTVLLEAGKTVQGYSYFDGRGLGIRTATETPDGWSVSAVEYDALGRARKSYNPFYASAPNDEVPEGTKYTEVLNTDSLGRTLQARLQDNSLIQTYFNGTVTSVTDQAGKQRRQVTDALGRIIRVDEPDLNGNLDVNGSPAQPTVYEYDGNDNLKKVIQTDASTTQTREFKYDVLSRLTHERQVEATPTLDDDGVLRTPSPTRWTKFLKYSNRGLLTEAKDARGVKSTFFYDGLNRIEKIEFSDDTPTVNYYYDESRSGYFNKGALTRVRTVPNTANPRPDTPDTATEFDYDNMGHIRLHRQWIGSQLYNLEYVYNVAGQLTSEKYPSGKIVSNNYDAGGRLSGINDQGRNYLSSLHYQSNGGAVSAMTLGNGIEQLFGYNDRLQVERMTWSKGGNVIQRYDYTFGEMNAQNEFKNNGKLAQIETYAGGNIASPTKQFTQKFDYDSIGRLKSETETRGDNNQQSYKQIFDYDNFGNRYLKAADNPATQNPLLPTPIEANNIDKTKNQLASNTGTTYDDAGNVTIDGKFRNLKYFYDANGRMYHTASMDDFNQSNSVYDASGQRVATQVNGMWKFFVYDAAGKMVAEYGGLPSTDEGGVKYVHQDIQGSIRAITSVSGAVKARSDYAAFGEEIHSSIGQRTAQGYTSSDSLQQKYALTERDEASGLDHTWFRKNENRAGRWTSPDPYNGSVDIGDPQSFNRYSYVENQPTNFVDPSGLNEMYIVCYDLVTDYHIGTLDDGKFGTRTETICSSFGGGGSSWTPTTGEDPGFGIGGGISPQTQSSDTDIPNDCEAALKKAGLLKKVESLLKAPPIYDVDKIGGEKASKYFGKKGNGKTVNQYFNGRSHGGRGATTHIAGDGITGIYIRGGESSLTGTLRLHEVTHLAQGGSDDLDVSLVTLLGIDLKGKKASEAVSNYFNHDCDPSLLQPKKGGK
jgi:RHS repeat-associated protein